MAVSVTIQYKEKLANKEVTRVYGEVLSASGDKANASDFELKTIRAIDLTPKALHRIAAASIGSMGELGNYAVLRITNTATTGASVEATGSVPMNFVVIGE